MKCRAILKIRDKEIPILYYSYRCHIPHYDDPNLNQIIRLHIEACEKIGNRECLPVEGDLITLMFECSGDEQFFYYWLNEGVMHNGEINFVYNEVEIADIFQFWDCFCLEIEEGMSTGSSSMIMTIYLSPGIIKRNNLEPREKVWKVSEVSQKQLVQAVSESNEEKVAEIIEVYWKDSEGNIINELPYNEEVTLYAKVKNAKPKDEISFSIKDENGNNIITIENCIINNNGEAIVPNFSLFKYLGK